MTAYLFGGPKDGLRIDDCRNVHEFVFPVHAFSLDQVLVHSYILSELLDGQWGQFVYQGTRRA